MREFRRFVDEQVLNDHAVHRHQCVRDVRGIRVRLGDVLPLDVHALELSRRGRIEHVRNAHPRVTAQFGSPQVRELLANGVVGHVPIPAELVRERPHVAGTLDVVLSAQGIDAHTGPPDISRGHRQVGHRHHHGRALGMLGDPEAVVDRRIGCERVSPRRRTNLIRRYARGLLQCFGTVLGQPNEVFPRAEGLRVASLFDKRSIDQTVGHDNVTDRVDDRHIGPGQQLQMVGSFHVRRADQPDRAWINDDEFRSLTQASFHSRGEHRVRVGGIRTDDHDDVRVGYRREVLSSGTCSERLLQAVPRGRVAHARTGIHIVGTEGGSDHLLDDVHLFVRAA